MGMIEQMKEFFIGPDLVIEEEITQEEIDAAKDRLKAERGLDYCDIPETISPLMHSRTPQTFNSSKDFKIIVVKPSKFDDARKLADALKRRKPVIVNFTSARTEEAKKIFDFLSGATYILGGNVQQLNENTYIFTANNVELDISDYSSHDNNTKW